MPGHPNARKELRDALKRADLEIAAILLFASVVDEISSAIGVQVQSSVVTEFLAKSLNLPYNEAISIFSTVTMFSYALMSLVPFYKALAGKFVRKPFRLYGGRMPFAFAGVPLMLLKVKETRGVDLE